MKVTRLLSSALCAAAGLVAACAPAPRPGAPTSAHLRIRAPDLGRPLRETLPAPDAPREPVARAVFERINLDRAQAGLSPVAWDEGAAAVARTFCEAQIREHTRGHFLMDGIPPYARTALAGLFGVQAENSTTWLSMSPEFQKSSVELALAGEADMLAEKPPADGHRRTILDPHATHVGVGWSLSRGSFRMAQEFLTRRLAQLTLSAAAQDPATILFEGRVAAPYRIEFVTFSREPVPTGLTQSEASARTSYAYPKPRLAFTPEGRKSLRVVGAETDDRLRVNGVYGGGGGFAFPFTPPQPGLWTVLLYTSAGREEPRPGGLAVVWVEPAGPTQGRRERPTQGPRP